MEGVNANYFYRVSLNNLNYLHESLKTFNWVVVDVQGDVIRFNDVFVSTYDLKGYKLLYDSINGKFYLSFY
jgi:hypothetical protein